MKKARIIFLCFVLVLFGASVARADYIADITYDYAQSGNQYTFDFTVNNTSTGADTGALDFFGINFDADAFSLYSAIAWTDTNGWATDAFQYDPGFGGLPGAVLADAWAAYLPGIAQDGSVRFSVTFQYDGSLPPTAQLFSFWALFGTDISGQSIGGYEGFVRYEPSTPGVPEPCTMLLLGAGLVGAAGFRRRFKK